MVPALDKSVVAAAVAVYQEQVLSSCWRQVCLWMYSGREPPCLYHVYRGIPRI